MKKQSYIQILALRYPEVQASASGDPRVYENIVVNEGSPPLPSKEQLDADIIQQVKIDQWEAIKAERDRRITGGVKVPLTVDGVTKDYWFHSDDISRIQQLALVILGGNVPAIQWKTMSGEFVTLDQAKVQAVFQASISSDAAKFQVAEQHKAQMLASANPEDYDFSGGWPAIYEGSPLTI